MGSRFTTLNVDCAEPEPLARFWAEVLGSKVDETDEESAYVPAPEDVGPGLFFIKVPESKSGKNRIHIDLNPSGSDQDQEVERVLSLGARRVDIGQGDVSWVVLADPEGNEFCILSRRVD